MFRKERRGGIERRILTSILVVGITPIILTLAIGFFVVQQAQRKEVNNTLSIAARKTAGGILLSLDSRLRTVRALARDPDVVSILTAPNAPSPEAIYSIKSRLEPEGAGVDCGCGKVDKERTVGAGGALRLVPFRVERACYRDRSMERDEKINI